MSDAKPRRTVRDTVRVEPVKSQALPPQAAPATVAEATLPVAAALEALEAATSLPQPTPDPHREPAPSPATSADDTWVALAEAQSAMARGFEAIAAEMAGMTRTGIASTSEAAIALISARTLTEAIEINAGLVRRGVDSAIESSARLSEIGMRTVSEASQPLLSRLGARWSAAGAF